MSLESSVKAALAALAVMGLGLGLLEWLGRALVLGLVGLVAREGEREGGRGRGDESEKGALGSESEPASESEFVLESDSEPEPGSVSESESELELESESVSESESESEISDSRSTSLNPNTPLPSSLVAVAGPSSFPSGPAASWHGRKCSGVRDKTGLISPSSSLEA